MTRLLVLCAFVAFAGLVLVLAELPWFARRSLTHRLRPYSPTAASQLQQNDGVLSLASFRDAIAPLAQAVGRRVSAVLGVHEDLSRRLERIQSPHDAGTFRVRQLTRAAVALIAGGVGALAFRLAPPVALLFTLGSPLLVFLILEHRVASASAAWQRRVVAELPVVAEQLGMLLGAGYSLGSALQRLAARGNGACSVGLAIVCARVRHGLSEEAALREWADLIDVDALHRFVSILSLNRDTGDLSRLITEEARAMRRDAHRRLVETIERRAQMVWIPVTVAALVPGVLFIAIPFASALALFSGS